jgi:hypothetical protein
LTPADGAGRSFSSFLPHEDQAAADTGHSLDDEQARRTRQTSALSIAVPVPFEPAAYAGAPAAAPLKHGPREPLVPVTWGARSEGEPEQAPPATEGAIADSVPSAATNKQPARGEHAPAARASDATPGEGAALERRSAAASAVGALPEQPKVKAEANAPRDARLPNAPSPRGPDRTASAVASSRTSPDRNARDEARSDGKPGGGDSPSPREGADAAKRATADMGPSGSLTAADAFPVVVPGAQASPVNALTLVTPVTPGPTAGVAAAPTPSTSDRLREAFASVANQSVIRGAASGEVVLPELGRVAVHARSNGSTVEIDVTADRGDTRAELRVHSGAIETDLAKVDVQVGRLAIHSPHSATQDFNASAGGRTFDSQARDDGSSTRDGDGEDANAAEGGGTSPDGGSAPSGRVRIVL